MSGERWCKRSLAFGHCVGRYLGRLLFAQTSMRVSSLTKDSLWPPFENKRNPRTHKKIRQKATLGPIPVMPVAPSETACPLGLSGTQGPRDRLCGYCLHFVPQAWLGWWTAWKPWVGGLSFAGGWGGSVLRNFFGARVHNNCSMVLSIEPPPPPVFRGSMPAKMMLSNRIQPPLTPPPTLSLSSPHFGFTPLRVCLS